MDRLAADVHGLRLRVNRADDQLRRGVAACVALLGQLQASKSVRRSSRDSGEGAFIAVLYMGPAQGYDLTSRAAAIPRQRPRDGPVCAGCPRHIGPRRDRLADDGHPHAGTSSGACVFGYLVLKSHLSCAVRRYFSFFTFLLSLQDLAARELSALKHAADLQAQLLEQQRSATKALTELAEGAQEQLRNQTKGCGKYIYIEV